MGPNWAESWGEGDLESVEAEICDMHLLQEEGVERFTLLINHPTLDDFLSLEWQAAVVEALEDYSKWMMSQ